jgi:ABC-2 type transport system ATP-binding protein
MEFAVQRGERVALVGPDAREIARLADLLLGLPPTDRPDPAGSVVTVLDGTPAAALRSGRMGAVSRRGGLMPQTRVEQMLRIVGDLAGKPVRGVDIARRCGIADLSGRVTESLSGSERARTRLALAMVTDPEVLVLENPGPVADAMGDAGPTVVVVTSRIEDAAVADRFLVVCGGRLARIASAVELAASAQTSPLSFHADTTVPRLCELPGVRRATADGDLFHVDSTDSSATIAALHAAGSVPRALEVGSRGVREGYLDLVDELTLLPRKTEA